MYYLIIVLALLVGCSSKPIREVVTVTEFKTIPVPEHLLTKCFITKPPVIESYTSELIVKDKITDIEYFKLLLHDYRRKENILTIYNIGLLKDLTNCNNQINEIDLFIKNSPK